MPPHGQGPLSTRKHRFLHITELSHVFSHSGAPRGSHFSACERTRRPARTTEDDRCRGGRRQERQPRRNDQPAQPHRRARARWLCHHRPCLSRLPAARWPGRAHPGQAGHAERRRRPRAGRSGGADPAVDRRHALAGGAGSGHPRAVRSSGGRRCAGQLRGAFVGHCRRHARRVLRRPAGDLPQRHRHRRCPAPHQGSLRVAVQRPRHQLPRAQGLHTCRGGTVRRRAAHGALRPRRGRCDVHHRHRVGLPRGGVHHLQLWAG